MTSVGSANLDSLPEELKEHILTYLSTEPPSWSWEQNIPNLDLIRSLSQPLKSLSLVSKSWHRIAAPLLFSHLQIQLSDPVPADRIGNSTLTPGIRKTSAAFRDWLFRDTGFPRDIRLPYRHCWQDTPTAKAARWTDMLDTRLSAVLSFLKSQGLSKGVESLTLTAPDELNDTGLDYIRDEVQCLIVTAAFWAKTFEALDLKRVTLLGAPSTLACLLGCSINMQDAWAFEGMSLQLVSLWRKNDNGTGISTTRTHYDAMAPVELNMEPNESGRPALASLLYIRPWTNLAVNEGSYLTAYSTYEFFHKDPAGILYPISRAFRLEMEIESVAYKAVFPFSLHAVTSLEGMTVNGAQHLYLKLAPSPDDNALNDPSQVGKADINDCWGEVDITYMCFVDSRSAHRHEGHLAEFSSLETFTSGDTSISSIIESLETNMESLDWEQAGQGRWVISERLLALRDTGHTGVSDAEGAN